MRINVPVSGGSRWCGRTERPPAGAALWPGWVHFSTLLSNHNYPSTRSTQKNSCSFAWCGSLIIHQIQSQEIHTVFITYWLTAGTGIPGFTRFYLRTRNARPIPHIASGMISFFMLYFFNYCPSRFEVYLSRFFQRRAKSTVSSQVVDWSRPDDINSRSRVGLDYIGMRDSHNLTSSESHRPIIPLVGLIVIVRVRYGYAYTRAWLQGSGPDPCNQAHGYTRILPVYDYR